jgi:DNA recombination protein RmuC
LINFLILVRIKTMSNTLLLTIFLLSQAVVVFIVFKKQVLANDKDQFENINKNLERTERIVREEIAKNREELSKSSKNASDSLLKQLTNLASLNEEKLEKLREVVAAQLKSLQEDNSKKLEQMRETVDEKLHSTLEKRLAESFKGVSERLEKVHQGLGEMQTLAVGVGDLKKVLTNVKTRGTWGEIQLGNLLEQILTADQFDKNVITKKGSNDPVEFAIKLPGKDTHVVYLPIDAKFPKEDYERLLQAQDLADIPGVEEAGKALENQLKLEAKKISTKYIDPPNTTDFGVLYLPIEGLYAEVLRRPGLADLLQREHRIMLAGPTTIAALLNSLQMGFRTLAVEKRASEVWQLLGTVRTEFGHFGTILDKTQKKLQEASNTIEKAASKSRTIERKLKKVENLPASKVELELDVEEVEMINEPINDKTIL